MIEQLLPIAQAQAENHTQSSVGGMAPQLLLLIGFIAIFYFLIIRPQSKRAKAHKQLIAGLDNGDEVTTTGGLMGRVVKVHENALDLELAQGLVVHLQKSHVTATLPKGSIKGVAKEPQPVVKEKKAEKSEKKSNG